MKLSNKIILVFSFLFIFSVCPIITSAQTVDLCKGISYIAKSLSDADKLGKIEKYGEEKMGFETSYGDHPFMAKNYEWDKTRGRYTLNTYPKTEDEAKKAFEEYNKQLKNCFGAPKKEGTYKIGQSAEFEAKGLSIDLMLLIGSSLFSDKPTYSIYIRVVEVKP